MPACKCRYCQTKIDTKDAYLVMNGKQKAYFCNEEHYHLLVSEKEEEKRRKAEALEAARQKKKEEHDAAVKQYKADKDKVYYSICEIIGRKAIINTLLWKEWAVWNKVAANNIIGTYLEENKDYLCDVISKIENSEFLRIKYLSAILKNKLGDYKPSHKANNENKPKIKVTETFYEPVQTQNNKRRSLADLEDEF